MIIYNYTYNSDSLDVYCLFCGVHTISSNAVKECDHLILITTSETIEDSFYDKNNMMEKYVEIQYEEDISLIDYMKNLLGDDYLFLLREQQAPSHFEEYIIYTIK